MLVALSLVATVEAKKIRRTAPMWYKASSPEVRYTGRTLNQNDTVLCSWSGVYAHIRFEGARLSIDCRTDNSVMLNVWVDKPMGVEADSVITVGRSDSTIVLASGLGKGEHSVFIQKRTEGNQGTLYINGYSIIGRLLQAPEGKARLIEVIGDSYTCGFGTEPSHKTDPFKVETENCNYAYGCIIARYFDADYRLISHSGIGVARNYNDAPEKTMTERYSHSLDNASNFTPWTFEGSRTPDVVVIYLGTNDFSRHKQPSLNKFCSDYRTLIGKVRSAYGDNVPIVCVGSRIDDLAGYYVKEAVARCGYKNVSWMQFNDKVHNNEDELGASHHPNYKGQKKKAMALIPYISTVTGWSLEDKVVR